MAALLCLLLILFIFSDSWMKAESLGVGINYGQIANNLPPAARVAYLLGSLNITRVKLYDADPIVLSAFANSKVEFVIGLGNEYLQKMSDPIQAQTWIQQTDSPFLINVYPFFAYKDSAGQVPLDYALFQPNSGMIDPGTNLHYDNMLYAQIDAVYYAIRALGHTDIQVKVSETGWPSKGDESEVGASLENARLYNGNLMNRIEQRQGTPAKPNSPIDVFVFALFNENMKPGPVSERNYGLYYPDGTPVYNLGLQGFLPRMDYSHSPKNYVVILFSFLLPVLLLVCCL